MAFAIVDKLFAATIDQVGNVDDSQLLADDENPISPFRRVERVVAHGLQAAVVVQSIAAQDFKLIEKQTLSVVGACSKLCFQA